MTRAWDKEKFWVPDRNRTHDLRNTGRALYPLSYENSWRARSFNWFHIWQVSWILLCPTLVSCWLIHLHKVNIFFIIFHHFLVLWFSRDFCSGFKLHRNVLINLTIKCCGRWPRVSSKSCSKSPSMRRSFISLVASRLIVTCLFLGPISLLMSPKSVIL